MSPAPLVPVTDPDDPRLADYRNVPDPVLLEQRQLFVAEGRLVVRRLLAANRLAVRSLMVTPTALETVRDLLETGPEVPVFVVPQSVMNGVTGFNMHRGCLALGERGAPLASSDVTAGSGHIVVMERVANADNVGAIFRNAASFGAAGVLVGPGCTDPLYRKAVRTSVGAAVTLPFAPATPWPDVLRQLQSDGVLVIGLSPSARQTLKQALDDAGLRREARPALAVMHTASPERFPVGSASHSRPAVVRESESDGRHAGAGARVALVVGHEGEGLTAEAMAACTTLARIPMASGVDSLNVATATAIALYELDRASPGSRTVDAEGHW